MHTAKFNRLFLPIIIHLTPMNMRELNDYQDLTKLSKPEKYAYVFTAMQGLLESETDQTASLANAAALLKETFNWWWVGFYLVKKDELVLGPFQGPVACTRIGYGKGVCGSAWKEGRTLVVPNVHQFPGHIACSAVSNSEIVVPVFSNDHVVAVLDADSEHFDHFDNTDHLQLEEFCSLLAKLF